MLSQSNVIPKRKNNTKTLSVFKRLVTFHPNGVVYKVEHKKEIPTCRTVNFQMRILLEWRKVIRSRSALNQLSSKLEAVKPRSTTSLLHVLYNVACSAAPDTAPIFTQRTSVQRDARGIHRTRQVTLATYYSARMQRYVSRTNVGIHCAVFIFSLYLFNLNSLIFGLENEDLLAPFVVENFATD